MSERGRDAAAIGLLFLLAVAFCGPSLRQAHFFNDWEMQNLPTRAFFGRGLQSGEIRWWANEVGGGYPIFAESQMGGAYPGNWIFALPVAPWRLLSWSVILHLAFAGAGVYLLARLLGTRRLAALAGGAVYLLSAPIYGRAIHLNYFHGLAWLPWAVAGLELLVQGRRGGLLLGLSLGAILLVGHVHPLLLAGLLLPVHLLVRAAQLRPAVRPLLAGLGGALLLAGLCGAVQLLPLLELIPHTVRSAGLDPEIRLELSLTVDRLYTLFAPTLHGSPYMEDLGLRHRYGLGVQWEWNAFVGIVPLMLLAISPFAGGRRERWLFWAVAVAAVLLAMGESLPFYRWLAALPGWSSVRGPARLLALFSFGAAGHAALLLDTIARDGWPRRRLPVDAVVLSFVIGGIVAAAVLLPRITEPDHRAWFQPGLVRAVAFIVLGGGALLLRGVLGRRWLPVVVTLLVVDLVTAMYRYHPLKPPSYYDPPAAVAEGVKRVFVRDIDPNPLVANRHLLYEGIANLDYYTPLDLTRFDRVRQVLQYPSLRSYRWLGDFRIQRVCRHWLRRHDGDPGELVPWWFSDWPSPAAWTARRATVALDGEQAWQALDYASQQHPPSVVVEAVDLPLTPTLTRGLEVLVDERHRLALRADAPALAVVGRTGYPGWRVLDAQGETPAVRVDYLLMGAWLAQPGEIVRLVYRPVSIRLGYYLTLLGLALAAGWVMGRRR